MDNESEWRFIKTNRKGECTLCNTQLQKDELVLYSWKQKRVWCIHCAESMGHQVAKGSENNREREGQSTGASVREDASEGISARARWEIVTGDDGIIVLRRLS